MRSRSVAVLLTGTVTATGLAAQERAILVQSTTSTANSGLYDHILPLFEQASGIDVRVVAVGTGQAIRNARRCDGDVLLVHARPAEEAFVAEGYGVQRFDVMYNDFVIVGPEGDPAGVAGMNDAAAALAAIAESGAAFASRGDDSGTHRKEKALWEAAGAAPWSRSDGWYLETGTGMGATLNIAVGSDAYALTDRATWVSFGNKGDHSILVEGDAALFNQYGVIAVNSAACPTVNAEGAQQFVAWLLSDEGQSAIAEFRVNGEQLFTPNARD